MVSDARPPIHHPFGRFRVTTERMPDGREIHYYEWPPQASDEAADAARDDDARDEAPMTDGGDE